MNGYENTMKKLLCLLPLWLLIMACSDVPRLQKLAQTDTILAFGDSLTFGYGAPTGSSYPAVLSELTGLTVINEGISGEISAKGLKRLAALLDRHQPQLLILCHGANDMLQKRDLGKMASNLEAMIALAQQRDIDILLLAVPTANLFLTPLQQYSEVSDKMQVPLNNDLIADILSQPALHSDIIHPNALGYQKIAEQIHQDLIDLGAL